MKYTEKYGFMKPDVDEFYDVNVFNENMDKVEQELINLDDSGSSSKELVSTLTTGNTSLVFTDDAISSDSTIDIYTSVYGVSPKNASISGNTLTLTFKAQNVDIDVKVVVS